MMAQKQRKLKRGRSSRLGSKGLHSPPLLGGPNGQKGKAPLLRALSRRLHLPTEEQKGTKRLPPPHVGGCQKKRS